MTTEKDKNLGGRPAYRPTASDRRNVAIWKGGGMSNEAVAGVLKISRNTLELHFSFELTEGAQAKRAEVIAAMQKAARKGSTAAARLYLSRGDIAPPIGHSPIEEAAPEPADLGKKAQADADAQTAHTGNRWGTVLN